MNVSSIIFQIKKCHDQDNSAKKCKNKEEIDEYIKDLKVNVYLLEFSIDMYQLHEDSH